MTSPSDSQTRASSDPLLQPFQLKHLTLRNRLMSTAHEPAYSENGMPKERYRAYHVEKARGGIALTVACGSAVVSEDSPAAFGNLHAYKDEITPWVREMADAVHENGAAIMMQITHLGRRTNWNKADWLPVLAPSACREPAHRAFPKTLEDTDIARIVADYADAAERLAAAGIDGVEFEAYGHLMDQFWSPATNQRDDAYGGSLENRMRFSHEVINAVRDRVGPDFILGVRMVADEDWDRGLTRDEGCEIARLLIATGRIDFLNLIRGHIDSDDALLDVIPIQGRASGPHLDFCAGVRDAVDAPSAARRFPVFHAARIGDVATARHAVASGALDMVGMTRAHIADPHLAKKIAAGRENRIRPCVGATYCLDRIYEGGEALCIHNPSTGRELTQPHEIALAGGDPRRAVVVGAGPAGLEAARVLAERGHSVVVLEAAPKAGGQVRLAAAVRRRRELIGLVDWRLAECEALGVEIRYGVYAEAADVRAEAPDLVIVATGGAPTEGVLAGAPWPGAELATSGWDVLTKSTTPRPGESWLLYDDHGGHNGLTVAEAVIDAGASLTLVTPERFFAPDVGGLNHAAYGRRFAEAGVDIQILKRLTGLARDGNRVSAAFASTHAPRSGAAEETRLVDHVVVEHGVTPLEDLFFDLKEGSRNRGAVDVRALVAGGAPGAVVNPNAAFDLYRIGDAVAGRNIHAAIYDALRLCRLL